MTKKLKKIPKFKTEDEEREFWDTHSSVDYVDWSKAKRAVFPNLKLTAIPSISLQVSPDVMEIVKIRANKLKVPYQSLMEQYITQGVLNKGKF